MASETGILNPCYAEILKQEEREGCTDERKKFKKKKKVDGKLQHFSSSVDGRIVIEVFCTRLSVMKSVHLQPRCSTVHTV